MNVYLKKACDVVGGQTALANGLTKLAGVCVTQQRVRNWVVRGDDVPIEFMAGIEQLTAGQVRRQEMRPNDWQRIWPELVPPAPTQPEPEQVPA